MHWDRFLDILWTFDALSFEPLLCNLWLCTAYRLFFQHFNTKMLTILGKKSYNMLAPGRDKHNFVWKDEYSSRKASKGCDGRSCDKREN